MNHPEREEWVPYIFNEASPESRTRLDHHLHQCADCREQIEEWRRSLRRLNEWRLPCSRKNFESLTPLLKFAAAAVFILCIGFSIGRLTGPQLDVSAVQQALHQQMKQELAQMLREEINTVSSGALAAARSQTEERLRAYDTALERKLSNRNREFYQAIEKVEAQRVNDYLALKQDLDTVAVNTDTGLRYTAQQLAHVAGFKPAAFRNP